MTYRTPTADKLLDGENVTSWTEESGMDQGTVFAIGPLDEDMGPIKPAIAYMGQIAYGVVAPVIISFGIFTNILNVIVLTRPTLRGPTYRYLMWLAVANLLVCIVLLGFTLHSHHTPVGYIPALYLAHLEMPLGNALIASSAYIVVGLSIDRFVAVCHPRKYRNLHSHRVASVRIVFSFVIAFLIYTPMALGKRVVRAKGIRDKYLPQENFMITTSLWYMVYKYLLEISVRFAPAVLLAFLNIWIIIEFKKVSRRRLLMGQNVTELSGYPSQSMAEISQGTTQQPPKEDIAHVLAQLNETRFNVQNELLERSQLRSLEMLAMKEKNDLQSENQVSEASSCNKLNGTVKNSHSFSQEEYKISCEHCDDTTATKPRIDADGSNTASPIQSPKAREEEASEELLVGTRDQYISPTRIDNKIVLLCREAIDPTDKSPTENNEGNKMDEVGQLFNNVSNHANHLTVSNATTNHCSGKRHKHMSARRLDMERRLVLLLIAIIVAFFITNIPTAILSLTFTQDKRASLSYQIFRAIANNLEFLNFGLNFVLYFLFSQDIRKAFVCIIRRSIRHISKKLFSSSTGSKIQSGL